MKKQSLKQIWETAYSSNHTDTPSQEELEAKALYFVRTCKPKSYKQMKQLGEVEEYCKLKAKIARATAESLIATGEPDMIAWNRAIRSEILESETD
jgi:hypothetical protein